MGKPCAHAALWAHGLVKCGEHDSIQGAAAMMWEYMILEPEGFHGTNHAVQAELNRLGREGWELVGCAGPYATKYVLKRAIETEATLKASAGGKKRAAAKS